MSENKYEVRYDADKCPVSCGGCGTEGAPTVERKDEGDQRYLCVFCYETHFGNIFQYDHYREEKTLAKAIVQALHIVMARGGGY